MNTCKNCGTPVSRMLTLAFGKKQSTPPLSLRNKGATINGKKIVALGERMDRKTINAAKKNFEKAVGCAYSVRVASIQNGSR